MCKRQTGFQIFAVLIATAWLPGADAADAGVGFVNIPAIMQKAPQAKAAREKLQQEFAGRREALEDCQDEIQDLDSKLRRDGRNIEKRRQERMIDRVKSRRRECGKQKEEFEADFNKRRSEELSTLQKQISSVIERIAKKRSFNLIVGPPIIYVDEQRNLTDEVIKTLERENR